MVSTSKSIEYGDIFEKYIFPISPKCQVYEMLVLITYIQTRFNMNAQLFKGVKALNF